jgi:hypothetical protein
MSTNAVHGKETIRNASTAKVAMKGESKRIPAVTVAVVLAVLGLSLAAQDTQDKYTLQVPGGLAFSEFRGYEDWQTVAVSQSAAGINVILANKLMIDAYRAGVPGNGKPFPDGSKTVKIAWKPEKSTDAPDPATVVPGTLNGVGFMVRDSKRFADAGGWGWAQFKYDAASDRFTPFTAADKPPQRNDAKCGLACHTIAKGKDYVFTAYTKR